ncbi:beta-ketoacyl synthase N-terminal-like domain-containing protein [Streptomyces sp. NPDC059637]|uniref:beta-ketoacyl synthase N-terminal-like domain-containing protein n=1 Tax=Streptomyces sp. NPDC059637 TaxID=3347752 RepID=UPI0036AB8D22
MNATALPDAPPEAAAGHLPRDGALAITGWGTVCSLAIGAEEFSAAVAEGRSGLRDVTGMFEDEDLPAAEACAMPDFRVRDHLGRKGTSFFDRSTSLALVGCSLALDDTDLAVGDDNRERVGIVLGTTAGSIRATGEYSRETLVQDRPYLVNPMLFPNTVMNCAAGQAAIRHRLKGVNATVAGGQLAGLSALRYARNLIRRDYADALLVGSVEEFSPHTAWGTHHLYADDDGRAPVGEGSAVFVVEDAAAVHRAGRLPDAEVLAVEVGTYAPADGRPEAGDRGRPGAAEGLATCIARALERAGAAPSEVWAVASGESGVEHRDAVERRGIEAALGTTAERLRVKRSTGECHSASGSLQIAALLGRHRIDPALDGRLSVVTSCSPDGAVGAAVLRGWHRARRDHRG